MKLQSLWAYFDTWLTGLGGGEATLYGVLLTGFLASSGWLFRQWWKSKAVSHLKGHPDKDHEAIPAAQRNRVDQLNNEGPGISVGVANGSPITVLNLSVPDDVVRLHAGSTNLPPESAERISRNFLDDIAKYFRYLPLKGMGDNAGLRLRFPLVELFIPLNARLTLRKGDTLSEELRLAGRRLTDEEDEHLGKRLDEARPVLNLITEYSVLVILGDPGSGKSTVVRFLAYLLATGQGGPFGLDDYLPLLLPLAAYSEKLEHQPGLSLRRFAVEYFKLRMDLDNLGHLLDARLNQGKVLILLDGLDEVKNVQQRNTVVERVQGFLCQHIVRGNRVIMTSRIIGYREVRPLEI